jgi:hypothetical protein
MLPRRNITPLLAALAVALLVLLGAILAFGLKVVRPTPGEVAPAAAHPQPRTTEVDAVRAAIRSAQAGGPGLQLLGEPAEVLTRYVPGTPAYWQVAIQGAIRETIPARPPDIPERQIILPYLVAHYNDDEGEVERLEAYPASVPPDLTGMVSFDLGRLR